ncbi:TPA: hypothetical protein QCJ52_004826 [Enterobacter ludwigii]|nr:hypothetical protein [Enterobacter ludwigii]HDR2686802.1 hypothetical protein [Enterobacter ludwigii]
MSQLPDQIEEATAASIGTPEHPVLFSGRSSAAAGYTVAGTSESWRKSVARLAYGTRTREGEVLSTPPLQPSSSLFQIAVLVCPDTGVQIELSKVVTHRQRQWGFLAERALSYSCFIVKA